MELEYNLQEADLHALVEHQILRSPLVPQRIARFRMAYTIGFMLLAFGTYLSKPERPVSYAFALLAILSLLFYARLARLRLHRNIPRVLRAKMTEASLGHRRLRALPEGLHQVSPNSTSTVSWRLVGAVETGATHAFIPIDGIYSVVIPKAQVAAADLQGFAEAVAQARKAAA